jgi:hypothetical protein
MVVRVTSGFVIEEMFVGFFNRKMADNARKAPRIVDTTDTSKSGSRERSPMPTIMAITIDIVTLTRKYGR